MVSQEELISKVFHSLVPGLISIFLETVWVPLSHLENAVMKIYILALGHAKKLKLSSCVHLPSIHTQCFSNVTLE